MAEEVVAIRYWRDGKNNLIAVPKGNLKSRDLVVVETEEGISLGEVTFQYVPCNGEVPFMDGVKVRKALEEDLQRLEENKRLEKEAKEFFVERVRAHSLPMKVVDVECLFDRQRIIFYFTAENRVDFRELLKDLVQRFKMRIELRQIGTRQEARILRGIGNCGREVCCSQFLNNLDRVSVKMAKEQGLSLNPEKISGLCGRLMCCIGYEYDVYRELKSVLPKCGKVINTLHGKGKVTRHNVLTQEVIVALESGKEVAIPFSEIIDQE
ncbi:MAG: stage 0 sporulation protein [Syntrophales bacterium]|nr:stage 0 sporulation protein [Syntrophales bacterium]